MENRIGVIGGSGLYEMEGLRNIEELEVDTPFGEPSDKIILGDLGLVKMVFLPRHGRGHRITPTEINYRANIHALKQLGVTRILSVSAVGSMKEEIEPGTLVFPDQFYDLTRKRASTFFGDGCVAHVMYADPVCPELWEIVHKSAHDLEIKHSKGGTYLCMEGPQFSTRGESQIHRQWGVDVIGMTNATEAKLAREAEICYVTIALATDYDCWHESEEDVTVEAIIEIMTRNVENAKRLIAQAAGLVPEHRKCCLCGEAIKGAIITDPAAIPAETKKRLALITGKYSV